MKINEFEVETWMTEHEIDCKYNLTETCVSSLSLNDLQQYVDEDISSTIMNMTMDYGPIVGSTRLKQAILSLYENGSEDNITITHGAINANELVMIELLEPGDHVVSLFPTYQQLFDFPKSLGCEVSFVELDEDKNWMPSFEQFVKVVQPHTKMICLNSPNNPTGTTIPFDMMLEIIELAKKHDCYILCDEIYRGVNTETKSMSPSFADYYDKAIVTQSLSKVFSFAGLRLGWIKSSKEIIHRIDLRRDYHIISSGPLDDYLACLVLENKNKILKRSLEICKKNKEFLKEWLSHEEHISCVIPKDGTVCFLKYNLDIPSKEFCEKLQKETGIFFVPGATFGIENHLRFGLTQKEEYVKAGLEAFSNWLKAQSK
ncbi:MAG: aminotransferase class I/II-fold pyridoxal phosphate-dependent enzyme [Coprobacillus sp.]